MLARVHFTDFKVAQMSVYVSEFKNGPYLKVVESMHLPAGKERIVKVGCLPCKYMMLEIEKGVPVVDVRNISCFGLSYAEMDGTLGPGFSEILFDNAYDIIYKTKNIVI